MVRGYIYSLLAVALWSANFVIANVVSSEITPIELSFYRWLISFMVLLPFMRSALNSAKTIVKDRTIFLSFIAASLLGISTFNTLIYMAGRYTSSINMSLIAVMSPAFITIINRIFLGRPVRGITWFGVLLATVGCVVLITKGNLTILTGLQVSLGDILMLFAAISFSVYAVVQRIPKGMSHIEYLFLMIFAGLVALFPFYLTDMFIGNNFHVNLTTLSYILYLGIFSSLIAFYLWNRSIGIIGSMQTGVAYYLLPLFVFLIDYIAFRTELNNLIVSSFLLIFGGVIIMHFTRHEKRAK
ncbi:DMT family transporter [Acidithiobacillus ferrivorans]|uniref:DMT family transporter n=1 Tax=Acidithiobacillus ferrivorans TaxID=160808 RepID=UPI001C073CC4|nr:DMT family transporter [Acidithiobacillus ferrivorans]MBU2851081.1 DMT family transporter [Acidithiobacillus ferrivorans]